MDVLVVGGTGLISTAITRQLVAAGHDVTLYNRGETDAALAEGESTPDVAVIRGDRTDHDRFSAQLAAADGFDCAIDMVCYRESDAENAVRAFEGVVDQVVFCSTVDVYHRPVASLPVREDAPREPNVSEYGRQKAACEDVFLAAHDRGAFDATVIRPWSTYGEGGSVLHTFGSGTYYLDRLRRGLPIVVHGDGSGVWGVCHREDVARAFANAVGNEDAYGEAYHVTSEETMPWSEYHRTVARALDAPEPELVYVPTDVLRRVAPERTDVLEKHLQYSTVFDNAKARRDLDFTYTIQWEEGARRTIAWLERHDRIEPAASEPFDDRLVEAWRAATDDLVATVTTEDAS